MIVLYVCKDRGSINSSIDVFSERHKVYHYDGRTAYDCNNRKYIDKSEIPKIINLLLFHSGGGDPNNIPINIRIDKKCVFSSMGIENIIFRGDTVNGIEYNINMSITRESLSEIEEWVLNNGEYPKCFKKKKTEYITRLYILCFGYLIAHYNDEKTGENKEVYDLIKARNVDKKEIHNVAKKAIEHRNETEYRKWWREALNISINRIKLDIENELNDSVPREIDELITWIYSDTKSVKSELSGIVINAMKYIKSMR